MEKFLGEGLHKHLFDLKQVQRYIKDWIKCPALWNSMPCETLGMLKWNHSPCGAASARANHSCWSKRFSMEVRIQLRYCAPNSWGCQLKLHGSGTWVVNISLVHGECWNQCWQIFSNNPKHYPNITTIIPQIIPKLDLKRGLTWLTWISQNVIRLRIRTSSINPSFTKPGMFRSKLMAARDSLSPSEYAVANFDTDSCAWISGRCYGTPQVSSQIWFFPKLSSLS